MTSYERVMAALDHRKPDRPPLNLFGPPETWDKLKKHLRLEDDEAVRCALGADMRYVRPRYVGPATFTGQSGYDGGGTDMWGVAWEPAENRFATYNEVAFHPLAAAMTLKAIEEYAWPDPGWLSVSHLKDEIARLNATERRAIVYTAGAPFETAWFLRGLERFLMDLVECPDIAELILRKVSQLNEEVARRAVDAAEGQIDIMWSSSDIGMQTGMMMSPDIWRRHVKPWQRGLIEPFKQMGLRTRYHSDGSFTPVIEDFIEMGLDLLDPIQPKAKDTDANTLQRLFGGRLSFYGGVDTQELLPMGSPAQVEAEVLRLIDVLGRNGGYVVAASNAIQPDVPVENILTLFRTAREYRY